MRSFMLRRLAELHHPRPKVRHVDWNGGVATVRAGETVIAVTPKTVRQIDKVKSLVDALPLPKLPPGATAQYVDEADPEKGVGIEAKDGTFIGYLPIDIWDHARKAG